MTLSAFDDALDVLVAIRAQGNREGADYRFPARLLADLDAVLARVNAERGTRKPGAYEPDPSRRTPGPLLVTSGIALMAVLSVLPTWAANTVASATPTVAPCVAAKGWLHNKPREAALIRLMYPECVAGSEQ